MTDEEFDQKKVRADELLALVMSVRQSERERFAAFLNAHYEGDLDVAVVARNYLDTPLAGAEIDRLRAKLNDPEMESAFEEAFGVRLAFSEPGKIAAE